VRVKYGPILTVLNQLSKIKIKTVETDTHKKLMYTKCIAYHNWLLFRWVDKITLCLRYCSARFILSIDSTSSISSWYCTRQQSNLL